MRLFQLSTKHRKQGGARRWVVSTALCVALAMAVVPGQSVSDMSELIGELIDRDTFFRLAHLFAGPPNNATPVTFVDLDEDTFAAWGRPDRVPQSKLVLLINQVSNFSPIGVLVDIDLSDAPREDAAYIEMQTAIERAAAEMSVWLPRRTVFSPTGVVDGRIVREPIFLETPFDTSFSELKNVTWVSVAVEPEDLDALRTTRLWITSCQKAMAETLPSVQLAAYSLLRSDERRHQDLGAFLDYQTTQQCQHNRSSSAADAAMALDGYGHLRQTSPIPYLFPWLPGRSQSQASMHQDGVQVPLLRTVSAAKVAEVDTEFDRSLFDGRFVVIGASTFASRDIHSTPLLDMPGALILANTIAGATDVLEGPGLVSRMIAGFAVFAILVGIFVLLTALPALVIAIIWGVLATTLLARIWHPSAAIDVVGMALSWLAIWLLLDALIDFVLSVMKNGSLQGALRKWD